MWALSVMEPWAWLLLPPGGPFARPWKAIESRDWKQANRTRAISLVGQRIVIHAGLTLATGWQAEMVWHVFGDGHPARDLPRGVLLGEAKLVAARPLTAADKCAVLADCAGLFGLVFAGARRYPTPIACRGRQGFFRVAVPPETLNPKPGT